MHERPGSLTSPMQSLGRRGRRGVASDDDGGAVLAVAHGAPGGRQCRGLVGQAPEWAAQLYCLSSTV